MKKTRETSVDKTIQIDKSLVVKQAKSSAREDSKRACFIIMGGLDVGNEYRIEKEKITLGRDPDCDLVLRDDGISRNHAEVRRVAFDRLVVRDLGSTNGTFINGEKIQKAEIEEGEKVLLGRRTVLKFVLHDQLEQHYQRKLYESSTRDGLTGAYNRKYFNQKLVADLSFAKRHVLPFSLLMIDVDYFKRVNDTYGHRVGDKVLLMVTEAVQKTIRSEDVLARYGGEEFAIIAPGTDLSGAQALAERVRRRVFDEKVELTEGPKSAFSVTVSIGSATLPGAVNIRPEALISVADRNLYKAKNSGRNQVVSSEINPS